jgi:LuxR family maltose regulon positive regulatory protein
MAISHEARPQLAVLPPLTSPISTTFARPRRASVSRAALVQRIEQGIERKLTVIVAPAGWGKTSLLAEWMATTPYPVAWLPFEADDAGLSRSFRLLAMAINQAVEGLADDLLGSLRSPYPPSPEETFAILTDAIRMRGASFVLVLDDLHHVTDPDFWRGLRQFVVTLPDQVHVILSSRVEPPVSLARLRVQGELNEIRTDDLRFSHDEATGLFAHLADVVIDESGIDSILDRTEGWPAGLQLAGVTLRGGHVTPARIAEIRGTQREVGGFLCEEVFSCQTNEMRQFLMQASLFDKLSGPFLDAVLQRSDSQAMLQRAVDTNLFVQYMDCPRYKFRIHQLFRDYLRAQLEMEQPALIPELHRRAATWMLEQDEVMEAIDHLIAAGEPERSVELIDRVSTNMVLTSEYTQTFLRWVELLPRDVVLGTPRLLRFYVQALTLTGRLADAEAMAREMAAQPFYQDDPNLPDNDRRQAEVLAVQSRISAYRGDNARTIDLAERALQRLGNDDLAWQANLHLDLGWAWRALGDLDQSSTHFASASRVGWESGSLQPALWGSRYLAIGWLAQGRLREAIAMIEADLERARAFTSNTEAIQACLLISRGELLHAQYRLPEARASLEQGLALAQKASDAKILMNAYVSLALVEQAEGNLESAMMMLRRGTRIFDGPQEAALQACVALSAGQVASAERWARQSGLTEEDDLLPERAPAEQVTFAKVLLATGQSDAAVALLERLLAQVTERGWFGRAIEFHAQLSVAYSRVGDRERALASLAEGLNLAAPEGFVREFIEAGPEMFGLLRDLMRSRLSFDRDFATRILALRTGSPRDGLQEPDTAADTGLAETLTDRQLDVLRLMAEGKSNRVIADELYLAEGTVKAHVHQISTKLLARNRTEAVARARQLGLIG